MDAAAQSKADPAGGGIGLLRWATGCLKHHEQVIPYCEVVKDVLAEQLVFFLGGGCEEGSSPVSEYPSSRTNFH